MSRPTQEEIDSRAIAVTAYFERAITTVFEVAAERFGDTLVRAKMSVDFEIVGGRICTITRPENKHEH